MPVYPALQVDVPDVSPVSNFLENLPQQMEQTRQRNLLQEAGQIAGEQGMGAASNALLQGGMWNEGALAQKLGLQQEAHRTGLAKASRAEQQKAMDWLVSAVGAAGDNPQAIEQIKQRGSEAFGEAIDDDDIAFARSMAPGPSVAEQRLGLDREKFAYEKTKGPDRTSLQENLIAAGLVPGTPEFQSAIKTSVNKPLVSMKGPEALDKGLSERFLEAQDAEVQAGSTINLYETMDTLLDDPDIYTGTYGESVNSLKKMGQTVFGLDLRGVPATEVARKITDELALQFKKQSQDPQTTNYERKIYERMATGVSDSKQGRKLLVQLRVADLRHVQNQAQVWREHLDENGRVDPTVYTALGRLERDRKTRLGAFLEEANRVAVKTPQTSIDAGTDLRRQYGLE